MQWDRGMVSMMSSARAVVSDALYVGEDDCPATAHARGIERNYVKACKKTSHSSSEPSNHLRYFYTGQ